MYIYTHMSDTNILNDLLKPKSPFTSKESYRKEIK